MMSEALKLDARQIRAFLSLEAVTPNALSPFYALEPAPGPGAAFDAGMAPLVRAVCQPAAAVSARVVSVQGEVATRLYADKACGLTVRHWVEADGRHGFRALPERAIAEEAAQRLMLDIPPTRLEMDCALSGASLGALLGLIDGWRERTLLSLVDRQPRPGGAWSAEELYAAFRRSLASADRRWLTPLVRELYPGDLDLAPAAFAAGLAEIAPLFAEAVPGGFQLSVRGEELCASLSAPLGALRLSVRRLRNGGVVEEHLLGLRGQGSFCVLEIGAEGDGTVALRNASAPVIEWFLHTRLKAAAGGNGAGAAQAGAGGAARPPVTGGVVGKPSTEGAAGILAPERAAGRTKAGGAAGLRERIAQVFAGLPAEISDIKGVVTVKAVVAERKAALSRKKLTYIAQYCVDEAQREVRFTERLKETGFGLAGGGDTDVSPGVGFKTETFRTGAGPREGTLEEQSSLFGQQYRYAFDFKALRAAVAAIVREAGLDFKYQVTSRHLGG
jgi:hypothetical protein